MLCEICGRRQGIKKIVTVGGVKRAIYICPDCEARSTARKNVTSTRTPAPTQPVVPHLVCRACGFTSEDVLETNLVGCEQCYTDLGPVIDRVIRRCQPSGMHVGKAPKTEDTVRGGEYEHLRKELERAVKEERYGDAAALKRLLDKVKEGK